MTGAAFPVRSFDTTSTHTGRTYEVVVELPNRYHRSDKAYPLVVVLDGQWVFGVVRDAFRVLALGRELPEAVVVGITHSRTDLRDLVQDRAADFTPTKATAPTETGVQIPAAEVGNAALFRRAMLEEILPVATSELRLNGDRTLVGHSFSALFALDTLLTDPDLFDRWVLASPSVWWDDQVMFRREANHASVTEDISARVFISAGSDEGGLEGFGGHRDLYDRLLERNYPSLNLSWALFPGETHSSVIGGAVSRGLRQVFT
ncbi:MAG: alpha/beta hydrolase [Actinomycetia bacterium]|nr:alpha/beta hydrolase [Actinomycetes bacterium]